MKITTYNVNFLFGEGAHTHSGKEWVCTPGHVEARVDYFASLFKKIDADILFLQELASEEVLKRIIEKTGINYSYFIATTDQNRVGNAVLTKSKECVFESIPSFSQLPVFNQEDADTLGPRMFSRRDFVSVKTTYQGKSIFILGIHLKSNFAVAEKDTSDNDTPMDTQISYADGIIRSELFRASQAKAARQAIDRFFQEEPNAQVVVAGDFNTQESNPLFRLIKGGLKKLPDSLVVLSGKLPKTGRYSITIGEDHFLADHVLVSKVLEPKVSSYKILTETINQPQPENNPGSDHAPVILELE